MTTALPPHVREALQIKAELSKSSTAKFKSMLARTSADGRLRGMFQYHGAAPGRWSGRGVQLQNLPRDSYGPEDYEQVTSFFRAKDQTAIQLFYGDPFPVASKCIRGSLATGDDTEFVCADFHAIEAIGLAYLAGDEDELKLYRSGLDVYRVSAANTFNMKYEDVGNPSTERQVGKVTCLALGYYGGIGAFASMAKTYRLDLETLPEHVLPFATLEELKGPYGAHALAKRYLSLNPDEMSTNAAVACDIIKRKWRAAHPRIISLWKGLEAAAFEAVRNPGRIFSYRAIKYCFHGKFLKCLMPSGRIMHYYLPRIRDVETDWGRKPAITFMGVKTVEGQTTRQWTRLATFAGRLVENVCQGFCRDLLAEAMLRLDKAGYDLCLHVHDEAVAEVPVGSGDLERFCAIMAAEVSWAKGMPIEAEGWISKRYHK